MKAQQYAAAIHLASQDKREEEIAGIVERTMQLLRERGHVTLLPNIVRELERLHARTYSSNTCTIRVQVRTDVELHKEAIARDIETLNASAVPQTIIEDNTVIGGYEIRAGGKQIDRTHKRTLLHLYNTLLT